MQIFISNYFKHYIVYPRIDHDRPLIRHEEVIESDTTGIIPIPPTLQHTETAHYHLTIYPYAYDQAW
jgi:hypothetical protein